MTDDEADGMRPKRLVVAIELRNGKFLDLARTPREVVVAYLRAIGVPLNVERMAEAIDVLRRQDEAVH